MSVFVALPIIAIAIALWPVLGTSYVGLPIAVARLVTLVGFALCVFVFERTLVFSVSISHPARKPDEKTENSLRNRAARICAGRNWGRS